MMKMMSFFNSLSHWERLLTILEVTNTLNYYWLHWKNSAILKMLQSENELVILSDFSDLVGCTIYYQSCGTYGYEKE